LSRKIGKPNNVKKIAARKGNALNVIVQNSANGVRSVFASGDNAS
jgi:hypothetical protein